jgi:hypothetical protein
MEFFDYAVSSSCELGFEKVREDVTNEHSGFRSAYTGYWLTIELPVTSVVEI